MATVQSRLSKSNSQVKGQGQGQSQGDLVTLPAKGDCGPEYVKPGYQAGFPDPEKE